MNIDDLLKKVIFQRIQHLNYLCFSELTYRIRIFLDKISFIFLINKWVVKRSFIIQNSQKWKHKQWINPKDYLNSVTLVLITIYNIVSGENHTCLYVATYFTKIIFDAGNLYVGIFSDIDILIKNDATANSDSYLQHNTKSYEIPTFLSWRFNRRKQELKMHIYIKERVILRPYQWKLIFWNIWGKSKIL